MEFTNSNGQGFRKFKLRSNTVVLNIVMCKCISIDIACPFGARQTPKKQDKIGIYNDLKNEIKKIMEVILRYLIIPVVVRALGIVNKKFQKWFQKRASEIRISKRPVS